MARAPRKKKLPFTKGEVASLSPNPDGDIGRKKAISLAQQIFPHSQPATSGPGPAPVFHCSASGCDKPARQWETALRSHFLTPTCSKECLQKMIEDGVCGYENSAIKAASPIAGKYLMRLGKFDLRTMTPKEWEDFIELICMTYHSEVNITHMKALVQAATPTSDEMAAQKWAAVSATLKHKSSGPLHDDEIPF